jgi:dTDP-4-dehydrorhamnose 3,5-epimerase
MESLDIEGAWMFRPRIYQDARGGFLEWFRAVEVTENIGHAMTVAQANCSVSRCGVIRGIHFADVPPGQAKYVTCVSGAVLDAVVDLRVGSPTFAQWQAVKLDDQRRLALYLSEGLGHAFMALTEEATVLYLCSTPYDPAREHGVHPLDPGIGIDWAIGQEPILSPKDGAAPSLDEARRAGLLPDYGVCQAYASRLTEA